jgi:hypothetical protein
MSSTDNNSILSFVDFISAFDFSHLFTSAVQQNVNNLITSPWLSNILKSPLSPALGGFLFAPVLIYRCSIETFIRGLLAPIGCSQRSLVELFAIYWLQTVDKPTLHLPRVLAVFNALVHQLNTDEWLDIVEIQIINCRCISSALSLCLIIRAVAISVSSTEAIDDNWESLHIGLERWDLLLMHLSSMALLPDCNGQSLSQLIECGVGYYREQIGKWSTIVDVTPITLTNIFKNRIPIDNEWSINLCKLLDIFPMSLRVELILCDCVWESVSRWSRDSDINLLQRAIDFLGLLDQVNYANYYKLYHFF